MEPRITISIVTWNHESSITQCIESIVKQTYHNYEIRITDNGSSDRTVEAIRNFHPISLVVNPTNVGFSKAHNQVIHQSTADYALIMNPDVFLPPTFLETLVGFAEKHNDGGSFGGKLLRPESLSETMKGGIVDTTGLILSRNLQVTNRGEGEIDTGQFGIAGKVFGHSGALVLLKRKALKTVAIGSEYFDEDFFAYKEDADFAWRLQTAGYPAYYDPQAVAYHMRAVKASARKMRSVRIRQLSYKNHLLLIFKNESLHHLFFNSPWIITYELKKFLYLLFFEPRSLAVLPEFFKQLPHILQKRKVLNNRLIYHV